MQDAFPLATSPDCQKASNADGAAGRRMAGGAVTGAQEDRPLPRLDRTGVWLLGDVRLDARRELTDALRARGVEVAAASTDGDLFLLAYLTWGDRAVERLVPSGVAGVPVVAAVRARRGHVRP